MQSLASLHHLSDWALLVLRLGLGVVFLVRGGRQRLHGLQGVLGSPEEVETFGAAEGSAPVLRVLHEDRFEAIERDFVFPILESGLAFLGEGVEGIRIRGHFRRLWWIVPRDRGAPGSR